MSKNLIKILSICAAAILLPLIIVGGILLATEARGVTLKIDAMGVVEEFESHIAIFVNNEEQTQNQITIKKNTEVTITFTGADYDFEGWYNGNPDEVDVEKPPVSEDASFTFIVRGNTVLTAVANIKTYTLNVKYHAVAADTDKTQIIYNPADGTFTGTMQPRDGYTFTGLNYDGVTYNFADDYTGLGSVIVENANEERELDVTAVWECDYLDGFKLAMRTDTEDETMIWLDSAHQKDTDFDGSETYTTINFVDDNDYRSYSLEQSVMDYYNKVITEQVYADWDGKFYDDNGIEATWGGDFKLYISGNLNPVGGEGNTYHFTSLTFERLMTLLASDDAYANGLEGKTVTIVLIFE